MFLFLMPQKMMAESLWVRPPRRPPLGGAFISKVSPFLFVSIRTISFSCENGMDEDWALNRPEIWLFCARFYPYGTPRDLCGFDYHRAPSDVVEPLLSTKNQHLAIRYSGNTSATARAEITGKKFAKVITALGSQSYCSGSALYLRHELTLPPWGQWLKEMLRPLL